MLQRTDINQLALVQRFLNEGTFQLKGKDVRVFLQTQVWLGQFIKEQGKAPSKPTLVEVKPLEDK